MLVFHLCVQKVTSPESALVLDKVDYTEFQDGRTGSWNGAANGIIRKLKEAGVQRGQVISIDAHNNGPNKAAIFSAHYCKSLPGKGPLDIQYQCENTADQGWDAFYQNAAKFAEQNTGDRSDLVAITASCNCKGRFVMYTFYYTDRATIHAEQMARQGHGQAQGQTHFEGRISAFSLNGIWCGLALGIFPWFGQLRAVDEDTFVRPLTCGVPCIIPLLWPHFVWRGLCSREYRRTPGTNTFYWHERGNYRKEDGETFISRFCLGTEPIKGCGCRVCCF